MSPSLKQKPIKELAVGDEIIAFFILRKKELRVKKADGEPYLNLELGDASGRIFATLWEQIAELDEVLQTGDIVKVKGTVIEYKNRLLLNIEKIRKATAEDNVRPEQFLPKSSKSVEEMLAELRELISNINNPYCQQVLQLIFSENGLTSVSKISKFAVSPAGKLWHHNRIGGLLEHTLAVAHICNQVAQHYAQSEEKPLIDRDLLITAALLHDIGKIESYRTEKGFIELTDEGRLLGHIPIGYQIVETAIEQIPDFPRELRKQLLHLILSHHGELEQGAPVVPMTLEAIILYYVDELDSKVDAFRRIIKGDIIAQRNSEPNSTSPGNQEGAWSRYVKLLDRFIYFSHLSNHTESEEDSL